MHSTESVGPYPSSPTPVTSPVPPPCWGEAQRLLTPPGQKEELLTPFFPSSSAALLLPTAQAHFAFLRIPCCSSLPLCPFLALLLGGKPLRLNAPSQLCASTSDCPSRRSLNTTASREPSRIPLPLAGKISFLGTARAPEVKATGAAPVEPGAC